MTAARTQGFVLTGWHVLAITVGFFGLVIAVNTAFAVYALRTFPGEVSKTPYEDGLAYDKTLAARARQAALGWTAEVQAGPGPGPVLVRFADARGEPLDGMTVSGELRRPATQAGERKLTFRGLGRGLYEARADGAGGAWDLKVEARDGQGRAFDAQHRIVWP